MRRMEVFSFHMTYSLLKNAVFEKSTKVTSTLKHIPLQTIFEVPLSRQINPELRQWTYML